MKIQAQYENKSKMYDKIIFRDAHIKIDTLALIIIHHPSTFRFGLIYRFKVVKYPYHLNVLILIIKDNLLNQIYVITNEYSTNTGQEIKHTVWHG